MKRTKNAPSVAWEWGMGNWLVEGTENGWGYYACNRTYALATNFRCACLLAMTEIGCECVSSDLAFKQRRHRADRTLVNFAICESGTDLKYLLRYTNTGDAAGIYSIF